MALKVLGILGSPRLDGNTAQLLDAVLDGARGAGADVDRLELARMRIDPCRECRECDSGLGCVQRTDDMSRIYKAIREMDAIAVASPIFFMGVTSQTKAMIDRCQCFWVEKYINKVRFYDGKRRPKGLFVSCAGSAKPIVFEPAKHVIKAFFAAIDYEYVGEILLPHTDEPELASRKNEALEQAKIAGVRLCD
ncbi:MAG: flavodoxin family protein [Candidatus Thermoplasmatota archaeon]|nr:flavodoxin family protein [Candidatus Thermoplasmatota archaeon]